MLSSDLLEHIRFAAISVKLFERLSQVGKNKMQLHKEQCGSTWFKILHLLYKVLIFFSDLSLLLHQVVMLSLEHLKWEKAHEYTKIENRYSILQLESEKKQTFKLKLIFLCLSISDLREAYNRIRIISATVN